MSVRVSSWLWTNSPAKGSELLLLLAIADFADDDGRAWPSVDTLASKTRLSRRQTQTLIKQSEESHRIQVLPNEGPHGVNIYQVLMTAGEGGEKIAPVQSGVDGGAVQRTGGAVQRTKGVRYTSPEPSGTVKEPSLDPSSPTPPKTKTRTKASEIDPDFQPDERVMAWCRAQGYRDHDVARQVEQFVDHHVARGTTMKDWSAAFRTWMRKAKDWGRVTPVSPGAASSHPDESEDERRQRYEAFDIQARLDWDAYQRQVGDDE